MCRTPVGAYGVVAENKRGMDIQAKCHGWVEVQRLDWTDWSDDFPGWDVIQRHLGTMLFFDPAESVVERETP